MRIWLFGIRHGAVSRQEDAQRPDRRFPPAGEYVPYLDAEAKHQRGIALSG